MQVHIGRRLGSALAAAGLVAAGIIAVPATAHADVPVEICGPGYTLAAFRNIGDESTGILGRTALARNSAGTYCSYTTRVDTSGASYTAAWMRRVGDEHYKHDGGNYSRYAGPVYRSRLGGCLTYGGTIEYNGKNYRRWETRGPASCGGH